MPNLDQESANRGSIAERLALLKDNGENNWKKRVKDKDLPDELIKKTSSSITTRFEEKVNLKAKTQQLDEEVKSFEFSNLSERVEQIKNNSEKWKSRVEIIKPQSEQFATCDDVKLPFTRDPSKKSPPMRPFKCDTLDFVTGDDFDVTTTSSGITGTLSSSRSNSLQQDDISLLMSPTTLDQGFDNFFPTAAAGDGSNTGNGAGDSVSISDFGAIEIEHRQNLLNYRKRVPKGPQRSNNRRAVKQPLQPQLSTDSTSSESSLSKNSSCSKFAPEALAGLASTEDFTKISLKTVADPSDHQTFKAKFPLLVQIKGRRHVQCRLIEPKFAHLNDGDCFVLITQDKLYSFVGEHANVIEIKACKDFCSAVIRDKDYGCTASRMVPVSRDFDNFEGKAFCKQLKREANEEIARAGHPTEDELVESCLLETNIVYEFDAAENALRPVDDFWGQVAMISLLDRDKIFVFDFGVEFYVWQGKYAAPSAKKNAHKLAEELYKLPFDYRACNMTPFAVPSYCGDRPISSHQLHGDKRPDYAIFASLHQNMESILFRKKFHDWPEVKMKLLGSALASSLISHDSVSYDGRYLYKSWCYEEPNLILENSCLGRGSFFYDMDTRRHFDIINVSVKKWHASANGSRELSPEDYQHFYANEAYTIRWVYQISITVRELTGQVSNRATVGRDRYVFFNWQGCESSASERGISTLHMVELDKEKGNQLIVPQFTEVPAFVNLFKTVFIHKRRADEQRWSAWRMYLIHGNYENEVIAIEVGCEMSQLRSRGCLLLVHGQKGKIILWKGCKTTKSQHKIARSLCADVKSKKHKEFFSTKFIQVEELTEYEEGAEFLSIVGGKNDLRSIYGSLSSRNEPFDFTPKMYELSSKNGNFEAVEIVTELRSKEQATAFPFVQQDLYGARQPTLFMVDNHYAIYLWQGWWPAENASTDEDDQQNIQNRASENRWYLDRCTAMQTVLDYWKTKCCGSDEKYLREAYVITAGYEPVEFQTIFPEWKVHESVVEMNSQNSTKEIVQLDDYFTKFQKSVYSIDVLKNRPLPEFVNPTKLEMYLSDEDFKEILGMTKDSWTKQPAWKKNSIRKDLGLF